MPDHLEIYMAPQTTPGQLTLQADAATWERFLRGPGRAVAGLLASHLAVRRAPEETIRITLPEPHARRVLQLAGVSA